jgi:fumarate reductase subunit C
MTTSAAARAKAISQGARLPQPERSPEYTEYHPRWYRPKVSVYWWLGQRQYLKFIVRELSSVFVAFCVIELLFLFRALTRGPDAYVQFFSTLRSPLVVLMNVVSLFFVVFHTITWFNLAPHATDIRVAGKRVPDIMLTAPNYLGWLVVSGVIAWVLLR